ncbi:MAG: branched-chain amino acid ABC transporter permease [Ktedonobacteraceae bacterium]|nr:branched-chain amino acid ABC transporter permease [Ktedonobacteraceae bacterium]
MLTGLLSSAIYALMASGLTLTYGLMNIINVAQGILVILGAYLSYALEQHLHLDLFVGLVFTTPLLFVVGVLIERIFLRHLKKNRETLSILVLFAVAQVIEGGLSLIFTTDSVHLHAWYIDATVQVGDFYVPVISLFALLLSILLLTFLFLLVYWTRFGSALRASIQHSEAAHLIGIDVAQVQMLTFGLGIALCAAGGMAYGATSAFNPASSYDLISRLLTIIVMGGKGSLKGTLLASVLMLVIGNVTALIWSPVWSSSVFFALLIVLLLVRPQGLFGQQEGRQQ